MELRGFRRFTPSSEHSLDFSPELVEQWIREIRDVEPNKIKIAISRSSPATNGDDFILSLNKILSILHQLLVHRWKGEISIQDEEAEMDTNKQIQFALKQLASDTIPHLLMYMKNIVTKVEELSRHLLDVLTYLVALDHACSLSFPTLYASCLLHMCKNWPGAVDIIMKHLCYYVLPLVLLYPSDTMKSNISHMSMSATLMIVLDSEFCTISHHMMITGTLMRCKRDVCSDLLSVVAYGTPDGRSNALKVLSHYWPLDYDRPPMIPDSFFPDCEFSNCSNKVDYLCLEGSCALQHSKKFSEEGKKKLFLLLCKECNGKVHRTHSVNHKLVKITPPLRDVKPNCELRLVCSKEEPFTRAEVTCFGEGCTSIQDGYPVRMCYDCHLAQHTDLDDPLHVFQVGPQNPWRCEDPMATSIFFEAITKLLSATPKKMDRKESRRISTFPAFNRHFISNGPPRKAFVMLQQYLVPDRKITDGTSCKWFERIIALVLEWLLACHELLEGMRAETESESVKSYHGSLLVNFQKTVEGVCSNHLEIHEVVMKHVIPWFEAVCTSGNASCIAIALQPESPGHVQVGKMWEHSHKPIEQYKRTLSLLVLITQNNFLPDEAASQIYSEVMPQWMELLVKMRNTPGQMEKLKHLLLKIFPQDAKHDKKQIERFEFIREKFRQKDSEARQRALFWLQDLSRLKIVVPYTTHIFDDIFHKRTLRRASRPNPEADLAMPLIRKESTGSFSGYESESPLVSQFSVDTSNPSNTQAILNLNFALPKYIVMLDIWNSQLNLNDKKVPLEFESFQRFACHMLDKDWDGEHSSSDHIGSFNTCLFCQALAMWFSLASHITEHYSQQEEDLDDNNDGEQSTPPSKEGRVSRVFKGSSSKKKSRANTMDGGTSAVSLQTTVKLDPTIEDDSLEFLSPSEYKPEATKGEGVVKPSPRDRRRALIASHSLIEIDLGGATPTPSVKVTTEEQLPHLYLLFQLSVQKLHPHYHPDSLIQVINLVSILVTKLNVLKIGIDKKVLIEDVHRLFDKLWKILEGSVSFLSQSCVGLLLACQGDIIELEVTSFNEIAVSKLSKVIRDGFSQKKWKNVAKTVDKFSAILQFMTGVNEGTSPSKCRYHKYIELALGVGFCQMTRLLQSKDTIVTTRVEYCLKSLKNCSVEAIQNHLILLFIHVPLYRFAVIQTLSLLSSAIPEVPYLTHCLINKLLEAVEGLKRTKDTEEVFRQVNTAVEHSKKTSNASVLSGRYFKEARPSTTSSALSINLSDEDGSPEILQLQCDTISLLLKYISSTKSDFKDMPIQPSRVTKKGGTIFSNKGAQEEPTPADHLVSKLEELICRRFLIGPRTLCQTRVFETFIIQVYKMLDKNTDFCETKGMIPFILRLLGYSVSPNRGDYPYSLVSTDATTPSSPSFKTLSNTPCSFTLGNLPTKLQAPWLRVLFIVLYKYTEKVLAQQTSVQCLQWCIDVVLNTLLCSPHVCTGQAPPTKHSKRGIALVPESPSSPPVESVAISAFSESQGRPRPQQQSLERATLETVPEESGSFNSSEPKVKPKGTDPTSTLPPSRPPVVHTASVASFTSSFTSGISFDHHQEDPQHMGQCLLCHSPSNVFTEEVVALGVLVLGTCAHHAPDLVSFNLVTKIIPSISRVVIPEHYYWQDSCASDPPPGSAMSLAKQFLLTLLTQFAERRMFLYLMRHNHQELTETIFKAVASCLPGQVNEEEQEEEESLTQAAPVQYFLEDADSSTHFTSDITEYSLINLACYLEIVPETSAYLFVKLNHLDSFLKKLRQTECKKMLYTEETFRAFLRIIIQLLKFSSLALPTSSSPSSFAASTTLHAIFQEFPEILEEALQMVYFPTGGLITLVGVWYKAFLQIPSANRRRDVPKKFHILKLLLEQFNYGLTSHTLVLPHNLISLSQAFLLLLNEYVFLGYIDTLTSEQRAYAPLLIQQEQEVYLSSIVNSDQDTTGIKQIFTESMREALQYLACVQPRAAEVEVTIQVKLTVAQLVALRVHREREPHGLVSRILHGSFSFEWIQKGSPASAAVQKNKPSIPCSTSCFVEDNMNSLQVLGWLLLGAMCHNAIHEAIQRTNLYGKLDGVVTGDCEILLRLCSSNSEATDCVLHHVKEAVAFIVKEPTYAYYGLKSILCFSTIWTVYMENNCKGSLPNICHFWQLVVSTVVELPSKEGMLLCNEDIVGSFCEQTIIPLKRVRASCVPLLQPTWKRIINMLNDPEEAELPNYTSVDETSIDVWIREMLVNYVELESKYLPS